MRKLINKVATKKLFGKCFLCKNNDYNTLDTHRIISGEQGGEYVATNCLVLCGNCHKSLHRSDKIKIDRKYQDSLGRWVVHFWENGVEKWQLEYMPE